MPHLIEVKRDGLPVLGLPLEPGEFLIGSDAGCKLRLNDHSVEGQHARLSYNGQELRIQRLSHKEALLVNGLRTRSAVLALTDLLRVGEYEIAFIEEGDKAAVDLTALRMRLHRDLVEKLDLGKLKIEQLSDRDLWTRCENEVDAILADSYLPATVDRARLKLDVLREALGLGPIEKLLADPEVSEIMVNNKDEIFVERAGRLMRDTELSFTSNEQVVNVIGRIVHPIGRRIDESSPLVDARLKDGSRVNAIIPPLALRGPSITIRKFMQKRLTDEDLIRFGSVTPAIATFLRFAVHGKRNIVIAGGTGSGKTTLLNVLSNYIPDNERVVTIEDSAELKLYQPNLVSLESRPANIEGKGAIPIRELVKNALRMRPDRIVVGECRSGETLDMLQAMNTGHDGSLTTLHANNPKDAVLRIETMVMMAGFDLPVRVIRMQVASAVHIFVQQNRLTDGSRRVMNVSEVVGVENDEVQLKDIFVFRRTGFDDKGHVTGYFTATGYIPRFVEEFARMGMPIDQSIFKPAEPPPAPAAAKA